MPKLKCSVTGKETTVRKPVYDKLVTKFGSEEELKKKYVCREARGKGKNEPEQTKIEQSTENVDVEKVFKDMELKK